MFTRAQAKAIRSKETDFNVNGNLIENMENNFLNDANICDFLPTEIFVKIFSSVRPKQTTKLRLVCKLWKDIIDEHFDVKIKINDSRSDFSLMPRFLRAKHCAIYNFTKTISVPKTFIVAESVMVGCDNMVPFQNLIGLKTLIIQGNISRDNFMLLAEHSGNIEELYITGSSLAKDLKMFKTDAGEEIAILQKFLVQIKRLVITGGMVDLKCTNVLLNNLVDLFKYKPSNLKSLLVRLNVPAKFVDTHMLRFMGRCDLLVDVNVIITRNFAQLHMILDDSLRTTIMPAEVYGCRFTTLKLEIFNRSEMETWNGILKCQRSLVQLSLNFEWGISFDNIIIDLLNKNKDSLTKLELFNVTSFNDVCAGNFKDMTKLKRLVLHGKEFLMIRNSELLPKSIKSVVLKNAGFNDNYCKPITA